MCYHYGQTLEGIMLSEVSQREIPYSFTYTWNLKNTEIEQTQRTDDWSPQWEVGMGEMDEGNKEVRTSNHGIQSQEWKYSTGYIQFIILLTSFYGDRW